MLGHCFFVLKYFHSKSKENVLVENGIAIQEYMP